MKKYSSKKFQISQGFAIGLCLMLFLIACTKYNPNYKSTTTTTTTTSGSSSGGSSGSGPDPLPPYGGSGSGSSGSGSSGSGSGSGSSGGGSSSNNLLAYVQPFIFTGASSAYITINDSASLKTDGSYTSLYAGQSTLKYKIGSGSTSDPAYSYGYYFLRPYSYYSWIVFKSPQYASAETLLYNDQTVPASGTSQVRFVSLDPYTTTVPIKYRVTNYVDNFWTPNRIYLDHRLDSSFNNFNSITPGLSTVSFYYRDSAVLSFQNVFDAGKKYTVFSGAVGYTSSSRGQIPIPFYYVTRHN